MVGVGTGEEGAELVGGEVTENSEEGGERTVMGGELTETAPARLAGSREVEMAEVVGANIEAAVFSMVGCI